MDFFLHIDINIFSFFICLLILFDMWERAEKHTLQCKLFAALITSNMFLLVLDSLEWLLDGCSGQVNVAIYSAVNVAYYIMNPIPPFLWALYADYQVYRDEKKVKKLIYPFLIPVFIVGLLSLATPLTGFMFYLDENNIYHRGQGFPLMAASCYLYLIYTFLVILWNRRIIEKRIFVPLLLFPIPPLVGSILQIIYYGTVLVWSGMALSILITYINIQNRKLHTDYLTGVYNRREADQYLKNKIHNSTSDRTFSGILIDIDNFKEINDGFGHLTGDRVLEVTAELIKKSLRKDDFVARYGGDEFIVLLDIKEVSDLKKSVDRINDCIDNYNSSSNNPFKLSLSMGYDVYNYGSGMNKEQFLRHIDNLMYISKKNDKTCFES